MPEKSLDFWGREPHSMTGRIRPFPEVFDPFLQVSRHGPERI